MVLPAFSALNHGNVLQPGLPKQLFDVPTTNDWDSTMDGKRLHSFARPAERAGSYHLGPQLGRGFET